jgi:hypothetical protein
MLLTKLTAVVTAVLIHFSGNMAGGSPYSFEQAKGCGVDKFHPTCEIKPTCSIQSWRCAPPRWSDARGFWVVPETREAAYARYKEIASGIAETSIKLTKCQDRYGAIIENCEPIRWPEGPENLALALATTAIWESGLREDIEFGYPPMGRGPDKEACLVQVMPSQIPTFADWIPDADKKEWELSSYKDRAVMEEKWAQELLGDSPEALYKCFSTGARMLSRARFSCSRSTRGSWYRMMWSKYGTGSTCHTTHPFAKKRSRTFRKMISFARGGYAVSK